MRTPKKSAAYVMLASREIGILHPGDVSLHFTMGRYSLLDIMTAVLNQVGPADITISTWTTGPVDIVTCGRLLGDGRIKSLKLLIDRSFAGRHPRYCQLLLENFGEECITCMRTHAKVMSIRGEKLDVAITSSMNLNVNRRIEQYVIAVSTAWCEKIEALVSQVTENVRPGLVFTPAEITRAVKTMEAELKETSEELDLDLLLAEF